MHDDVDWINRAAYYELMASAFRYPSIDVMEALVSGEFSDAFEEIGGLQNFECTFLTRQVAFLDTYRGSNAERVMHTLRREHTRLFIGPDARVPAYAGIWKAISEGKPPLYMISKESMAIERFMSRCGIGHPEGTNEPLDHIASILEFLYYLCLVKANAVKPSPHADIKEMDYEVFCSLHAHDYLCAFSDGVLEHSQEPFFVCSARMLAEHTKKF